MEIKFTKSNKILNIKVIKFNILEKTAGAKVKDLEGIPSILCQLWGKVDMYLIVFYSSGLHTMKEETL